jgi:hypothetical protein
MSLALAMGKTLEELGQMSSAEFTLWKQYYPDAPWGAEWFQTALICSQLTNMAGKILKEGESSEPSDFMPPFEARKEQKESDPLKHFAQFL